jgi:hypothetical protein
MGKVTAAFFAAPNYPDLKTEHIRFSDVLIFYHTAISQRIKTDNTKHMLPSKRLVF